MREGQQQWRGRNQVAIIKILSFANSAALRPVVVAYKCPADYRVVAGVCDYTCVLQFCQMERRYARVFLGTVIGQLKVV